MKPTARGLLTRSLAAIALVVFYGLSAVGISSLVMGTPKAEARGGRRGGGRGSRGGGRGLRGGGRRGFRGGGRRSGFRGRGLYWGGPALYGYYGYYDRGCYWSPRRGRYICPYSYYPGYYW